MRTGRGEGNVEGEENSDKADDTEAENVEELGSESSEVDREDWVEDDGYDPRLEEDCKLEMDDES
jgi:hypothetical protein